MSTLGLWPLIILVVLVGGLMPLQAIINSKLAPLIGHHLWAAFFSFTGGFLTLFLICFFTPHVRQTFIFKWPPLYLLLGGPIGVCLVLTALISIPKIGGLNLMLGLLAGQLFVSALIDHFGLFGLQVRLFSVWRMMGLIFVALGVYCISFKTGR